MMVICPRPLRCFLCGLLMTATGLALTSWWPTIYKGILCKILELKPGNLNYAMWESPPVPIFMDFYFFNWTNPEEILVAGKKPHFIEMGPYRFIETKIKRDVVWNPNYTLSFKQERTWYFDAENSAGALGDEITTLNTVAVSSAYISRSWNYFLQLPLIQMLKSQPLAITHSVAELLFDGYSDTLIMMAQIGAVVSFQEEAPVDKFAWFNSRNASEEFEGVYNMRTGEDDITHVAELMQWEYKNNTKTYGGSCGLVRGSMGERFPPGRKKTEPLTLYSKEICRSVDIEFTKEQVVEGVSGYRYEASPMMFDNGTVEPRNECFCGGECVPSGLLNISSCQLGSPSFVSQPHFYQADPYYLNSVDGLNPDHDKHAFYAIIEPTTGLPLDAAGRLQVNILMQPYSRIRPYENLPRIFFPMLWFEERATITPKLALYVKLTLLLSPLGMAFALTLSIGGVLWMLAATVKYYLMRTKAGNVFPRGLYGSKRIEGQATAPLRVVKIYSPTTEDSSDNDWVSTKLLSL